MVGKALNAAMGSEPTLTFTPNFTEGAGEDRITSQLNQEIDRTLQQAQDAGMNAGLQGNLEMRTGGTTLENLISDAIQGQEEFLRRDEDDDETETKTESDDGITANDVETIGNEFETNSLAY